MLAVSGSIRDTCVTLRFVTLTAFNKRSYFPNNCFSLEQRLLFERGFLRVTKERRKWCLAIFRLIAFSQRWPEDIKSLPGLETLCAALCVDIATRLQSNWTIFQPSFSVCLTPTIHPCVIIDSLHVRMGMLMFFCVYVEYGLFLSVNVSTFVQIWSTVRLSHFFLHCRDKCQMTLSCM